LVLGSRHPNISFMHDLVGNHFITWNSLLERLNEVVHMSVHYLFRWYLQTMSLFGQFYVVKDGSIKILI
jgi:hypothetical protein